MGIVIQFPRRSPVHCSEVTEAQAEAAQVALFDTMTACPDCAGRGVKIRMVNPRGWYPSDYVSEPCPCGGTDEDRIEPDFDGAA